MRDFNVETMLAIEWGIVPLILIGILAYLLIYTPGKNTPEKIKNSSTAGKLAGLFIFTLLVLYQKERELSFTFNIPAYNFNISVVLISIVSGFVLSWFFNLLKKKVVIGLYVLISVASTSTAIYCYLFIQNLRSYLIFITMGIMIGILIHAIFFPKGAIPDNETTQD